MNAKTASFLLEKPAAVPPPPGGGKVKAPFLDKGIHHIAKVIRTAYLQWETASQSGFFQGLDPRLKVLATVMFIVVVSLQREVIPELALATLVFVLAAASHLDLAAFYRRVAFFGFFFGFLIALPSALNLISPGRVVLPLATLESSHDFWLYHIPREIGLTGEGLRGVALLTTRVANSVSLSLLLLYTTPFTEIVRALKVLKVPDTFLLVLTLAYKYIFIFAGTVEEMHLAMKSRMVGGADDAEARRWIAGRLGRIFTRSQIKCEELYKAMLARGFSGEVKLRGFEPASGHNFLVGLLLIAAALFLLWI